MKALTIFCLNVIQNTLGMAFGWLFRSGTNRNSYKSLSDMDKVLVIIKIINQLIVQT